jgi:hypothetical protein
VTMLPKKMSLDMQLKSKSRWSVRLGSIEWAKFTYERSAQDPLHLLGSARKGQQSGALAKLNDAFVLVVGDHVTTLSHADDKALAAATTHAKSDDRPFVFQPVPTQVAKPVVVVIKRRRIPAPH